ncbi:MAG: hypothetical protein COA86_15660 [Kangiella sp.]|nr:MAG: hypothetical protein COA86_15660 [Kangiella sp.]
MFTYSLDVISLNIVKQPKSIRTKSSWIGTDIVQQEDKWMWHLSKEEIDALEMACNKFLKQNNSLE